MKKICFSSVSAIFISIAFQSFSTNKKIDSTNWFQVNSSVNAAKGIGFRFKDNEVTKIAGDPGSCAISGTGFDCVVTFANNQLTSNLNHIHTVGFIFGQPALTTVYTRSSQ